jgi:hypothetical protein
VLIHLDQVLDSSPPPMEPVWGYSPSSQGSGMISSASVTEEVPKRHDIIWSLGVKDGQRAPAPALRRRMSIAGLRVGMFPLLARRLQPGAPPPGHQTTGVVPMVAISGRRRLRLEGSAPGPLATGSPLRQPLARWYPRQPPPLPRRQRG